MLVISINGIELSSIDQDGLDDLKFYHSACPTLMNIMINAVVQEINDRLDAFHGLSHLTKSEIDQITKEVYNYASNQP